MITLVYMARLWCAGAKQGPRSGTSWLFVCPQQGEDESVTLKSCTRRKTDSIEKRFCFDVEAVDRWVAPTLSQEQILLDLDSLCSIQSELFHRLCSLSLLHPSTNTQCEIGLRPVPGWQRLFVSPLLQSVLSSLFGMFYFNVRASILRNVYYVSGGWVDV